MGKLATLKTIIGICGAIMVIWLVAASIRAVEQAREAAGCMDVCEVAIQ